MSAQRIFSAGRQILNEKEMALKQPADLLNARQNY